MDNTQAKQEFDATAEKYGGEKAYNQAKESGKTALTYKQWVQVRTPSFKAWFGDWENDPENASKVLNPDTGEPLVVYHGTNVQGRRFFQFNTEKPAWFSTYKGYAQAFIGDKGKPTLYTAFLNIRNPVNVGDIDGTVTKNSLSTLSEKTGVDISTLREIYNESKGINLFNITNSQQLKSILAKQGVDSISAIEGKVKSFGVFSPEQIKSATDNIGTFDRQNPDIRFDLFGLPENDIATIEKDIRIAKVLQGEPVAVLNDRLAPHTGMAAARQWGIEIFKAFGYKETNPELGEIICDENSIRNTLGHGLSPYKVEAIRSIQNVIKQGVVIADTQVGREEHYFVSAPVAIENK